METLEQIYQKHKKGDWPDKGSVHSYIEVYEEILAPYRKQPNKVLEIGLMNGESLRMWDEYFEGVVYGMDYSLTPLDGKADLTQAIKDGCSVFIGDATNHDDVYRHFSGMKFDVIIEDANHNWQQQFNIYETLEPYLAEGGIYIIEDIQNIDSERLMFAAIDLEKEVKILDRRHIKNRYDDVLVIIRK